jgi:hypothetical protein
VIAAGRGHGGCRFVGAIENGPGTPPAQHCQSGSADRQCQRRNRPHLAAEQLDDPCRNSACADETHPYPQTAPDERSPGLAVHFAEGLSIHKPGFHAFTFQFASILRAATRIAHGADAMLGQ